MNRREVLRAALGAGGALALPRDVLLGAESSQQRPHLEVALRAERWLRRSRIETERGVHWPANPDDPKSVQTGLYNGYPGVILFLVELAHATGDPKYLDEAKKGAYELASTMPGGPSPTGETIGIRDAGLYTGMAGTAFVLDVVARAANDARLVITSARASKLLEDSMRKVNGSFQWSASNDIISGTAGTGLYLLRAGRDRRDKDLVALAVAAGRHLLDVAEPSHGGLKWAISPQTANKYPNFSHGAAGVGYFLATLFQETSEPDFLNGALAAARYLDAVARKEGDGWMVFHHEPGGEDLFYLSWCHGPAGTARLFYRLNQVTRDPQWLELMHKGARATIAQGIPEKRTPGFWNNISQCCGNCGVGEFFLAMQKVSARPEYLQMALRAAGDTLSRGTADGDGMKWIQAEHRVQPNLLIAQTGHMQGAAGVGSYFLHLDAYERGVRPAVVFPDNPFV